MSETRAIQVDIAIVGGGLVGASLACALAPLAARQGWQIAVIEAMPMSSGGERRYQPSFDERSSAIALGSRRHFDTIGLWDEMAKHASPIRRIHVSERGRFGATRMRAEAEDACTDALGHVIPNAWMGQVLTAALNGLPFRHYCPARVEAVEPIASGYRLSLNTNEVLDTHLMVLADGGRSPLKAMLGIDDQVHDYHEHALIANVEISRPHMGVAYERFDSAGPMALLPLEGQRMGLVWTRSPEALAELLALDDNAFLHALQHTFGDRVGRFRRVGERHHYPLAKRQACEQIRPHLAVLGNAAHSLHPVAGQGFNLALRGVMDLCEALDAQAARGEPLGSIQALSDFEVRRRQDRQRIAEGSHLLVSLFGIRSTPLSHLRSLGLAALDVVGPARRALMRRAMGVVR